MPEEENDEIEMFVAGLVLDPATNAPIVVLKDEEGGLCLPIWIGLAEATAIASALKQVELVRPMTHDLMTTFIDELGARIHRVFIRGLEENTFLADIELVIGDTHKVIDARPSDAIALAVRTDAPVFVAADVLDRAQMTLVPVLPEDGSTAEEGTPEGESKGQNFANISEDKWEEILAEMDPDDFKYKM